MGRRTIGLASPSVARVREGLVGRGVLVSSRTSDSCGGLGAVCANQGGQVHSVSSGALASGLDACCVKSTFVSPEPVREL